MTGQTGTIAYGANISSPITLAIGDSGTRTQQWLDKLVQRGDRVRLLNVGPPVTATEVFSGVSRQIPIDRLAFISGPTIYLLTDPSTVVIFTFPIDFRQNRLK
ncbi:MAG: hypothetical protein AAGM36_16540 [Cyanobacteria bacterium J06597_1]